MADKLQEQKRLIRNQIRARDAEIELFVARVEKIIAGATRDLVATVETVEGIESLGVLGQFETVLAEAGLRDELKKLRGVYAKELKSIQQTFEAAGFNTSDFFGGIDNIAVETLIKSDFDKVSNVISRYGTDVKAQVARSVIAGQSIDLNAIGENVTPKTMRAISAEVNTGMAAFNRTVTVTKAKDLIGENPSFLYLGQDDKVTRDFCRGLLHNRTPSIYTLAEINNMSNGQLEPVIAYGGGYNCRHEWRPISNELRQELYGT